MACFILIAGNANKSLLLLGLIPTLAGALFQFRSTGLLSTKRAVTALQVVDGQLYAQLSHSRTPAMQTASPRQPGAPLVKQTQARRAGHDLIRNPDHGRHQNVGIGHS